MAFTKTKTSQSSTIADCYIIDFSVIEDSIVGSNTIPFTGPQIPFTVSRVFYIYNVPDGKERGGHAHKKCRELIIVINGSLEVKVYDGALEKVFLLNGSQKGLFLETGIWASQFNFSKDCVCLVLASMEYSEDDYMRDIKKYRMFKASND